MNIARQNSQFLETLGSLADYRRADRDEQMKTRVRWMRTFEDHKDASVRAAAKELYRQAFIDEQNQLVENTDARPTGMQDDAGDITKGDLGA